MPSALILVLNQPGLGRLSSTKPVQEDTWRRSRLDDVTKGTRAGSLSDHPLHPIA